MNDNPEPRSSSVPDPLTLEETQQWLAGRLASELELGPDRIRTDQPILSYGVDSMQMVSIIASMEDRLGIRFSANPLDDHPTIESLSEFALSQLHDSDSPEN